METIIQNIFISIFGQNPALITFFISMMPIIELKGALPFGLSNVWDTPLPPLTALVLCVLGGMLASGVVLAILHWTIPRIKKQGHLDKLLGKYAQKASALQHQKSDKKRLLLLCFFTLIPLPLTGYYTSCVIAELVGLAPIKSWCAINLGNLISGAIILALSLLSSALIRVLLYVFFGLFVVYGAYLVISMTMRFIRHHA